MPLVTLDEYGRPSHWAHREPDAFELPSLSQEQLEYIRAELAKPARIVEEPPYFWLGEEAEDDGWITVHGTTV